MPGKPAGHPAPSHIRATHEQRDWLAEALRMAVTNAEASCPGGHSGIRGDLCAHVVGWLLSQAALPEAEADELMGRALGYSSSRQVRA